MKKKILASFLFLLIILPTRKATSQTDALIDLGKSIMKWGDSVSKLSDKAQTANEMKHLIEDLACAKYKFDNFRANQTITSCIGNTNITLIDVEYSSLYREIYSMTKLLADPNAMDDSKVSTVMQRIRSLLDKLSSLNDSAEGEFLDQQKQKSQREFASSVIGASF